LELRRREGLGKPPLDLSPLFKPLGTEGARVCIPPLLDFELKQANLWSRRKTRSR
jgi:hypothetical protein